MTAKNFIQEFLPSTDSPEKIYELFRGLGYPEDKVLDPTYQRKIEEFELATFSAPFIRYLAKRFSDKYLRFLLILTGDYKEYTFIFPECELIEEGNHKLKLTRLIFSRENPYHTDLLTISTLALTGEEENWRDIWLRWKEAFSVEKVTGRFFEELKKRNSRSIFEELGINPNRPIREQKPNPLPDRKALDDIVFDILGLTQEERGEVYWSVCELVKNRLEKARSV